MDSQDAGCDMTIYRDPPKCKQQFRKDDVVWTPLRHRAVLKKYNIETARWSARYVNAIDGQLAEETLLDPRYLTHAE